MKLFFDVSLLRLLFFLKKEKSPRFRTFSLGQSFYMTNMAGAPRIELRARGLECLAELFTIFYLVLIDFDNFRIIPFCSYEVLRHQNILLNHHISFFALTLILEQSYHFHPLLFLAFFHDEF